MMDSHGAPAPQTEAASLPAYAPFFSPASWDRSRQVGAFVALLVAGFTFAVLGSNHETLHLDRPLLQSVQLLPGSYERLAWVFNDFLRHQGIPLLWAATILGLVLVKRHEHALLFTIAIAVGPFTSMLKQLIDRPRPAGTFNILEFPSDPSFPSGHVMTAMAFFGLWFIIAAELLPRAVAIPVRVLAAATVLLTAVSRVWAGAHWPTDVAGGLVWGAVFLVLLWSTRPLVALTTARTPLRR
ncbi:MAG: phosphatase PAP2 family protein [Dehalococcoidia bacterium]|nr:phosphatase PAP2 family protein [Dehalococcoidia bacterium]